MNKDKDEQMDTKNDKDNKGRLYERMNGEELYHQDKPRQVNGDKDA